MSWAVTVAGKPLAVMGAFEKKARQQCCDEPEESLKNRAIDIVNLAMSSMPNDIIVKVVAHGSQAPAWSDVQGRRVPGYFRHSFSLEFHEISDYVE